MSEQNKALAKRWFKEVWEEGNEATIDELFHPEGHAYGFPTPDSDLVGPEAFKELVRSFTTTFSAFRVELHDIIAEDDRVAIRWTSHMTHTGDGLGFAPTNKRAALAGSSFVVIRYGKIFSGWNYLDLTAFAQKLQST